MLTVPRAPSLLLVLAFAWYASGCGGSDSAPARTDRGAADRDAGSDPDAPTSSETASPDAGRLDAAPPDVAPEETAIGDIALGDDVRPDDARAPDALPPDAGPPPAPRICFTPDPVDFGEIGPGQEVGLQLSFANCGSAATSVTVVTLSPQTSRDFRLEATPALPLPLAPDSRAWLDLRYAPTGADADHGQIVVTFLDERGRPAWASLTVSGSQPATGVPVLTVTPDVVRFDDVPLGAPASSEVVLANDGGAPLSITRVGLSDDSHAALALARAPIPGMLVQPGGQLSFDVVFTPDALFPVDEPLGAVVVESNVPDGSVRRVPVHATPGDPRLALVPADLVDFGPVGQGQTTEVVVRLWNVGGAPLDVLGVVIEHEVGEWGDEFRVAAPVPLGPPVAGGLGSIGAGEAAPLALTFTNFGPDAGEARATLTVESAAPDPSDPDSPPRASESVVVPLTAERRLDPTLPPGGVVVEPDGLDFGALAAGETATRTITLRNRSTTTRRLVSATLTACERSSGWFSSLHCDEDGAASEVFRLTPSVPAEGLPLAPDGEPVVFTVEFAPAGGPADHAALDEHFARFRAEILDEGAAPQAPSFVVPGGDRPNVQGTVGWPRGFAWPTTVSFGEALVGCASAPGTVSVYASRDVPVRVLGATPGPECGVTFGVVEPATFPPEGFVATPAAPLHLALSYRPAALGEESCTLAIHTNDADTPDYAVSLVGQGVDVVRVEDDFVHRDAPPVDVLFVVDDSGSMCEEQARLAANLDDFIHYALTWGNDFRIGVVTTCVHDEAVCDGVGALRSAHPPARWVDSLRWEEFLDNVTVGCWGGSDPQEAGLQAAWRALTPPNATLAEEDCASADDCAAPALCLADAGRCGGANGGFLRPGAALEVVVLSDEEDQSDQPVAFYTTFFATFRSLGKGQARLHAIVGDEETGCTGGGTAAQAGDRYVEAARATQGIVASICDDSFAEPLARMGEVAFGTRWTYHLSRTPAPDSILVLVDGVPCDAGWVYDADDNAVRFTPGAPCAPHDGDAVSVKYDRACLP